jgi:GxxExxY protein
MNEYKIEKEEWLEYNEPAVSYGDKSNLRFEEETYEILSACFEVHNNLGQGFLESVYQEALEIEFNLRDIQFEIEKKLQIYYKEHKLKKTFEADFLIFDNVILEIKAQEGGIEKHYKQVLNYLKASKREVALLVNFGEDSLKYKRIIFTKH